MIAPPLNDQDCLGPTTDYIRAALEARDPALVDLAARFSNTDDLAAWFRSQPQRDDNGDPNEEPKITACRPAQRIQLDNEFPNCFERTARFVGSAELIEPERIYRLATVATPNGLHTFPLRDEEPVILDPTGARNATPIGDVATRRLRIQRLIGLDDRKGLRFDLANARRAKELGHTTWVDGKPIDEAITVYENALARYQAILAELDADESPVGTRNHSGMVVLTPQQAIDWIAVLARQLADRVTDGVRRVENGHRAMRGVLALQPICMADIRDVALALALAERAARSLGLGGLKVVHSTARAIDKLDQLAASRATRAATARNNPFATLALAAIGNKDVQQLLGGLARVAGRIAGGIGMEAAKVKLASAGISPPVLSEFEKQLNREGMTLGPLAKPAPMVGSLDAMAPQALAGRWLAQRLPF
ncbi:MAG: hypothetical protein AB7T06_10895 [Kofleriaceae bacterium]